MTEKFLCQYVKGWIGELKQIYIFFSGLVIILYHVKKLKICQNRDIINMNINENQMQKKWGV